MKAIEKCLIVGSILLLSCTQSVPSHQKNVSGKSGDTTSIDSNIIGVIEIYQDRDTLTVLSDKDLTWAPFGVETTLKAIKAKFPFLNQKDTTIYHALWKKDIPAVLLFSPNSSIVFKRNESNNLYYASLSKDITLIRDIKVGMSKKAFFESIFGQHYSVDNKIKVVINADPADEFLSTYFIFSNDSLKEIRMLAPY